MNPEDFRRSKSAAVKTKKRNKGNTTGNNIRGHPGPEELSDHSAGPSHRDSGTTHANDPFEQGTSPTHPDATAGHDTNIGYVANAGYSAHAAPEPTTPAEAVLHDLGFSHAADHILRPATPQHESAAPPHSAQEYVAMTGAQHAHVDSGMVEHSTQSDPGSHSATDHSTGTVASHGDVPREGTDAHGAAGGRTVDVHGGDQGAPVKSHGADPKGISAHTQPSGPEELSDHCASPPHRDSGTTHGNDPFEQGTSSTHW